PRPPPARRARASPPPGLVRLAPAGLEVPVVARLSHESLLVEAEHRAPRERLLLAVRENERRPPLDRGPVALLDGLAEPHVLGWGLRKHPRRVGERRLGLAKRRRAEDAIRRIQRGRRSGVVRLPRGAVAVGPAPRVAHYRHGRQPTARAAGRPALWSQTVTK